MSKKLEGKKCPKFNAECTSGITYSNKDFDGKNLVIYFYPKDSTICNFSSSSDKLYVENSEKITF